MRKIVLFLFPFIIGCGQNKVYQRLTLTDSLLRQEQVDSALQNLNSMNVDSANSEIKAYYSLLLTQALFKNYQPISSDSLINISCDYYKKSNEKEKYARSLLYRGNLRLEMGKDVEAMKDYKTAEGISEQLDDDVLKHNVFFAISYINSIHSEFSLALDYLKKAKECATKAGRNDYLVYDYQHTSIVYYNMAKYDSSYFYINKSIQYINLIPEKPVLYRAHLWTNLGVTCYMLNDFEKAKQALEKSISVIPLGSTYATLARISLKEKDTVAAIRQLEEGMKVPDTRTNGVDLINLLSQIEQKRGNYHRSAELANRAFILKDSLAKRQHEDNVKALQIDMEWEQEEEKARKIRLWLLGGIAVMAVTGAVTLTAFAKNGRKKRRLLEEKQHSLDELREAEKQANKELAKAKEKVNILKHDRQEQEKTMREWQKDQQRQEETLERGHHLFVALTNGGNTRRWTRDDFRDFRDYYNTVDKTFSNEVAQKYGQLSQNLYVFAVLEHLGKSEDEIMDAMGLSLSALRTTRSRLNQKKVKESKEHF